MELELVRYKLTSPINYNLERFTEYQTMLVESEADVKSILIRLGPNPRIKIYWTVEEIEEVGRVPFHQEDAFILGLKVGDVL